MTTLQIQRSTEQNNRRRSFKIFIDGKEAGTIENGELKSFTVIPGAHKIQARIDWCGSPEVQVYLSEGQTQTLQLGGFRYVRQFFKIRWIIFGIAVFCWLVFDFPYFILLFPLTLLPIFYFLTFGRMKYLTLEA